MKINRKFKTLINRAFAVIFSAIFLSFAIIPASSVYAFDANAASEVLWDVIGTIMATFGYVNGSVTIDDFMRYWYNFDPAVESKTVAELMNEHINQNENTGSYTIDADLYNLIQQFMESLKDQKDSNGVPVVSQIYYDKLYLNSVESLKEYMDPSLIVDGSRAGWSDEQIKYMQDTWYTEVYKYFGQYYTQYNNVHGIDLYKFYPWYYTLSDKTSYKNCGGQSYLMQLCRTGDYELFLVGDLEAGYLNKNYQFDFYKYDSVNDVIKSYDDLIYINSIVAFGCNCDENGEAQIIYYPDGSVCYFLGYPWVFKQNANNYKNLPDVIGKDLSDQIYKDGEYYKIPTWVTNSGGIIKVFKTTIDLQLYLQNGGRDNTVIDNSKHVKNVTITNDNHVEYIYYSDDDPENPDNKTDDPGSGGSGSDDSGSGTGKDYTQQLSNILKQLQDIKNLISNLDLSGGSGTADNIEQLNDILVWLGRLNTQFESLKSEIALNFGNLEDGKLTDINNQLTNISNDINTKLNTLNQNISDLLDELIYLQEITDDQTGVLRSILSQVSQINAKMSVKRTIDDTKDNIDWLIDQLKDLIDNGLDIPDDISEMLGTKFPFSVPYVLVAITHLLEAPPKAPEFRIPLKLPSELSDLSSNESGFTAKFVQPSETPGAYCDIVFNCADYPELANTIKMMSLLIWIVGLLKITPAMLGNGKEITDERGD